MTNNSILLLFAIINVIVTGLFAGLVLSQYARRHRVYQLYWSISLTMAFLATLSYVFMVLAQPTSSAGVILFRLYYILGGALVPAWLGLGSLALVASKGTTRLSLIILSVLSVLAIVLIATAGINMHNLSQIAGTPGTGILEPSFGAWTITIIVLNTLGVLAVVGVAIYSGWKLIRPQTDVAGGRERNIAGFHPGNLVWANVLILVGDLLNGAAGTLARFFGLESSFWLIMALGWIVFFVGFLLTTRRPARTTSTPQNEIPGKVKGTVTS